jgi:DNA-binding YbaB/EbfC family protein
MKLPKHFGGQGLGGMMKQAQEAMERAQNLEVELAAERISIDKGPVIAVFSGTGEIQSLSIDPSLLSPDEKDVLEDLLLSVVRDGFQKATDLRNAKVQEIMPNMPNIPGL